MFAANIVFFLQTCIVFHHFFKQIYKFACKTESFTHFFSSFELKNEKIAHIFHHFSYICICKKHIKSKQCLNLNVVLF